MTAEGKTTIAPDVLLTIARLSCLNVEGVSRMATTSKPINRLLSKSVKDGVQVEVEDDTVYLDLYVILKSDVNVREVSRMIQQEVTRAISEMVGMQVGKVNIHIEDIDYPQNSVDK
ncbi:MAG: Asp23/Gls24 family envelope stress response protein [Anaerolineales bacterium]